MKNYLLAFICLFSTIICQSQKVDILPRHFAKGELEQMPAYISGALSTDKNSNPPPFPVRTMAEWEELQAIIITWRSFPAILTEITRAAVEECDVIIICSNCNSAQNTLSAAGVDDSRVIYVNAASNSIWVRDYGPNTVYAHDIDSLVFVDWIYNRPRPLDDQVPTTVAAYLNVPIYETNQVPNDLVHTGGNFMADGRGVAFSSRLVLDENGPQNNWGTSNHDEAAVESIMSEFMGIEEYIKMTVLPFDAIHHIDMHMKLLDERTLIVGEYPQGIADGPQIEANIQYVLNNFTTPTGQPYDVIRVPMPPDFNGTYPNSFGDYRTYANMLFMNRTIIVPTYEPQYDTVGLRIIREAMPGYNVVGIDCNSIIPLSGALHCITKEVGVHDPLWISHYKLEDVEESVPLGYEVEAIIKHRMGISEAQVWYTTDLSMNYVSLDMSLVDVTTNTWSVNIPEQANGSTVYYYIDAVANSGKTISKPLAADQGGHFEFDVSYTSTSIDQSLVNETLLSNPYPNPASAITCIPVYMNSAENIQLNLIDALGKKVQTIFVGESKVGDQNYFIDASTLSSGYYMVQLLSEDLKLTRKLIVK